MPVVLLSSLLGLLIGPAVHHAAVAAGARRPLSGPRPMCPSCGEPRPLRAWFEGRCSACGDDLRRREWTVTGAAVLTLGAAAWVSGPTWLLPAYLVFGAASLVLVVTDLDHKLIPNRILYPGGAAAVGLLVVGALLEGRGGNIPAALLGAVGYFGILFVVALIARGGFGFGDVKLGALLGFFTGFEGLRIFLLGIFFTGVFGGIPAIVLLLTRRARAGDELPYGPAMMAGTWAALVFGQQFLTWYGG